MTALPVARTGRCHSTVPCRADRTRSHPLPRAVPGRPGSANPLRFQCRSRPVRRRARVQVGLVAGLVLAVPSPSGAQQVDSLPFRDGQWGAEFTAADFSGVGALRFTSSRSAWLIDVQGRFTRQSGDSDSPSRSETVSDPDALQLRLGWRRYGTLAPRVVRHVGVGVLGDLHPASRARAPSRSPPRSRSSRPALTIPPARSQRLGRSG